MQYIEAELKDILDKHYKWLMGKDDGKRADFTDANLRGADLRGADLRGADLRGAYLRGANLRGADLSGGTKLDKINWLTFIGIQSSHTGKAYAYKVIGENGEGIYRGGINYLAKKTFTANIDTDTGNQCGSGVNLATFRWCLDEYGEGRRLLLMEFNVKDAVCPVASDGKFRVSKCRKVAEVDWNGNIMEPKP